MNFENSTRTVPLFVVLDILAVSGFTSFFVYSTASVVSILNELRIFWRKAGTLEMLLSANC